MSDETVVVENDDLVVIDTESDVHVTLETEDLVVVSEAEQGPEGGKGDKGDKGEKGDPGISEDDVVYAKRLDMVSSDVFYRGEAQVGSSEDAPVWRIRRVTMVTVGELVDLSEEWADGEATFVHRWTDRATLTYR